MNITIKEVKEALYDKVAGDFIGEGFSFNKTDFSFKKKKGKDTIRCEFTFYGFPVKVEYNFSFVFFINELEKELEKFRNFCGTPYVKFGIHIREGDYHPLVSNTDFKYRVAFTHTISDIMQDKESFEETRLLIKHEFFPRLKTFSDLKYFQNFVLEDYSRVTKYGIMSYAFLALKMKNTNAVLSLIEHLKVELRVTELDPHHATRKIIEDMALYAVQPT